ncbi:MAG: HopJ type III effector protein [Burkholderiaceae bacterium]
MRDVENLLEQVRNHPETIQFPDVIVAIDKNYEYSPQGFSNGGIRNEAGTNEGSCKILAFARMHELSAAQALALFGDYYRIDVLQNPNGTDHANIRNFIEFGWSQLTFDGTVLK